MEYQCEINNRPAQPTLAVRTHTSIENLPAFIGEAFGSIVQYLEEMGEQHAGPAFAIYYNLDMQDLELDAGFIVARPLPGKDRIQPGEIPGGDQASVLHIGSYDDLGMVYETLTAFVKQAGREPTGRAYEFYLNGPADTTPENFQTRVMFPLKPQEAG